MPKRKPLLKEIIEAPEKALQSFEKGPVKSVGKFWHILGPGLTTGAADDDPSGIATYSQAGSRYGFQLLWLAPLTLPFMAVVQEMCARIGLVTGRGLAANIRLHFPRWVLFLCTALLFFANTFNIGADLGAMAAAMQLLTPGIPVAGLLIAFTIISLLLQIFVPYAVYARILKWLALLLLSYVLTALTIRGLDWGAVLYAVIVPSLSWTSEQIILLCAIFGTTISPYLFFWQTSQEVEEEIMEGATTIRKRKAFADGRHIRNMRVDVWFGMFFSNAVMFFIILTCAAVLNMAGVTEIETASEAAAALAPLAGAGASFLFALGIIGIGLLAVPVLAGSAAYALAESFRWKEGLYRKFKQANAFYAVIAIAMVAGLLMNFLGLHPIRTLIWSAVLNGLVAPVILILILLLTSRRSIMGKRVNGPVAKTFGWTVTIIMGVVATATLWSLF